ncbi:MAG: hypothetical protein JWN60_746 [Acidobacteria bacterium]|nr:hypothetical protein [Acidobacteriota bacterium]
MRSEKNNNVTRRDFLKIAALGSTGLMLAELNFGQPSNNKKIKEMLVYIGTYTSGKSRSEGIYIYKLNLDSGELKPYKTIKGVVEPSFLAIDKDKKYLYAVNETVEYEGKKSGAVSAFAIDGKTGDLKFLNKQPSLGGAPCHVSISDNGKFVLVANYVGGNVSVFPVEKDGKLGAPSDSAQHKGTGPNKERQEAAHAHSINLDPENRFAVACDLGADKIFVYRFDYSNGTLEANAEPYFQSKPGAGPRHFAFHPDGEKAFVINELDSTLTALAFDKTSGVFKELETVSTLPANWTGSNTCADLHISPDGKFVYGSNRGHDSIASFVINEKNGRLESTGHTSTGGKTPRNFVIDPTGKFLLAANQNSDSIVVFRIDDKTGKPGATGISARVPTPVCLKLMPAFS